MVRLKVKTLLGLCALLAVASNALADVHARVDRPSVDLNESFVLEIMVDTNIDMEPDLSVLDENFLRGQLSQLSNTSIIRAIVHVRLRRICPLMIDVLLS